MQLWMEMELEMEMEMGPGRGMHRYRRPNSGEATESRGGWRVNDAGGGPDTGDDDLEYCAACGTRLPDDVWCPVRTVEDDDVERVVAFCDEDCEDAWTSRR